MNIAQRIEGLLRAGDINSIILGATLLQSLDNIEEELKLFENMCDSTLNTTFEGDSRFMTLRYISISINIPYTHKWFNVIGKRWIIYAFEHRAVYLLRNFYSTTSPRIEI